MMNRTFKSGESREQPSLLPPRIEDYVGPDNPVRAIESYVCALDLAKLGFRHADRGVEVGQPPYDPADLLKLYLYGYINQVRSSRRLGREACRNLELIWLLKNLKPGYRTIANFRKDNWKALKAVNRSFVLLARELGLVGGSLVAIDGALFHGDASKASIFTRRRLAEQIANLDREIEAYGKSLEDNDATEVEQRPDGHGDGGGGHGDDFGARGKEMIGKRARAQADLEAPSFRDCRTSLRHHQMPRWLSALPGSRLQQGSRRMEPDGALLQLHPRAQHPWLRALRRLHGGKDAFGAQTRSRSRSALHSARSERIQGTNHLMVRNQPPQTSSSLLTDFLPGPVGQISRPVRPSFVARSESRGRLVDNVLPDCASDGPAVRRSPNRARTPFLRRAIERDSPAILMSAPPVQALRALRSPRQPATAEQIRCPPAAHRWRRTRFPASVSPRPRRVAADPAAAHAEWRPPGLPRSIQVLPA